MLILYLFVLLLLNESINSFYLPPEYRSKRQARIKRAHTYLKQFGYFENFPLCPSKEKSSLVCAIENPNTDEVTEKEALKKFQQAAGLKQTGLIDDETIQKMNEPRCGNSDLQKLIKKNGRPWKTKVITYTFLNFTDQLEKTKQGQFSTYTFLMTYNKVYELTPVFFTMNVLFSAFQLWQMLTSLKFYETRIIEKANIKISFEKGNHGDNKAFDGPGLILAHAYKEDGRLHFDNDEKWKIYSDTEIARNDGKDLLWVAVHEIGHILGLQHSISLDSLMDPFYSSPVRRSRSSTGNYSYPRPTANDIENIQIMYGTRFSKPSKIGLLPSQECSEFCYT